MRTFILVAILLLQNSAFAMDILTKVEQGSLVVGRTDPANRIFFGDREVLVNDDGLFVFAIDKNSPKEIVLREKKWYGVSTDKKIRVHERKWGEQKITGIDPSKITPPESEIPRIQREFKEIRAAKTQSTQDYFPGCFIVPIERARISGEFGVQRTYNGIPKSYHGGIDYAAPKGTKVKSAADGVVAFVHEDMYYNGKAIVIDNGFGVFTTYIHLSRIMVKKGDKVRKGESIGMVGSTGRSTGPHLHFGVDWYGVKIDPQTAISNKICN